jgi:hypothetical protein
MVVATFNTGITTEITGLSSAKVELYQWVRVCLTRKGILAEGADCRHLIHLQS